MRAFELIACLIAALALLVVLQVIGVLLKFALAAAALGFMAGLLLVRALRPKP